MSFNDSIEITSKVLERITLRIYYLHTLLFEFHSKEKVEKGTLQWFRRVHRTDISILTAHILERMWMET